MAQHNDLGKEGEKIGLEYLRTKGYKILETNWRHGHGEIDIIALDGDQLVIVEVKTRTVSFLEGFESVNKAKQKLLINATSAFIRKNSLNNDTRFDILFIISNSKHQEINHIENAFYPGF